MSSRLYFTLPEYTPTQHHDCFRMYPCFKLIICLIRRTTPSWSFFASEYADVQGDKIIRSPVRSWTCSNVTSDRETSKYSTSRFQDSLVIQHVTNLRDPSDRHPSLQSHQRSLSSRQLDPPGAHTSSGVRQPRLLLLNNSWNSYYKTTAGTAFAAQQLHPFPHLGLRIASVSGKAHQTSRVANLKPLLVSKTTHPSPKEWWRAT